MDFFTHTLMGAALCSRTGLAGGRRGPSADNAGKPRVADWTLATALFFGAFPDLFSLGIHTIPHLAMTGEMGWQAIPAVVFVLYDLTHSLLIATPIILAVFLINRPLAVSMLAWPLHIVMDMLTHGPGRFATPVFFPLSDYRFSGMDWWKTPWLFQFPLLCTLVAWWLILRYRRKQARIG